MADREAKIRVALDGSDEAAAGFDRVGGASESAGQRIRSALGGAVRDVGRSIAGLATESLKLVTSMGGMSMGQAVEEAKRLDMTITRLALGSRRSFADMKSDIRGLSLSTL